MFWSVEITDLSYFHFFFPVSRYLDKILCYFHAPTVYKEKEFGFKRKKKLSKILLQPSYLIAVEKSIILIFKVDNS